MLRFGLILAAIVIALDQITKYLVLGPLGFSPPGCLEDFGPCGAIELSPIFDLRMVWNRGVSFGLMRAGDDLGRWLLVLVMLTISGVFAWWLKDATRRLTGWALGLVIGGAIGNVIDRIRFGAVVDFLDFSGLWFPWVFNVADASITVGAILLLSDMLLFSESEPGKGTGWARLKAWRARLKGDAGGPNR